jgi:hypothetical protein
VFGTLVACLYEYGYASKGFGLPVDLIVVDTSRIICSTALVGSLGLCLFGVMFGAVESARRGGLLIKVAAWITFLGIIYLLFGTPLWALVICAVVSSITLFPKTSPVHRGFEKSTRVLDSPTTFMRVTATLMLMAIGSFAVRLWESHAVAAGWQMVADDDPSLVLARRYGDSVVLVEVDLLTGQIGERIEIRDASDAAVKLRRVKSKRLVSWGTKNGW